jgi:hypothetical protein
MTRLSEEEKRYLKYQIYSFRYQNPWIPNKKIAKAVNRSISTVNRYAKKAEEGGIIWNPSLGLYHPDRRVALLLFEDKWKTFKKLQEQSRMKYLSVFQGDWDIMVIYDGNMDFSQISGYKGTVMKGFREKVFTPKVKYSTWKHSFEEMDALLNQKLDLEKSSLICEPCYPDWDEEDWKMFSYFRPNLRKKFSHLRKKYPISWRKYEEWKKTLRTYCTIMMEYYPEGYESYNSLTLCFQTSYEEFIVTLFSQLPTTCFFYKMGEYLLTTVFTPQDFEKQARIYEIISQLIEKKIITDYRDGNIITYYIRNGPAESNE